MPLSLDLARIEEHLLQGLRSLSAPTRYQDPEAYFGPGELRPGDPGYFIAFDRISADFPGWLDPGPVEAPPAGAVRRDGEFLHFASAAPTGDDEVDRVAVRLYPAPPKAPSTGVLFHHWLSMGSWLVADWFLASLVRRFRVAAMVAPHHLQRCRSGLVSGEGFVNTNPRHVFEGFRQWQADHLATVELLARDHGFEEVVTLGYSLGGYGALLNRLIRGPRPTVAVCVTNHYARGVFEGDRTAALARRLEDVGFTPESFERATRSLHLARWAARISGRDLTLVYARADEIEPPESLRELREALDPDRLVGLDDGHSTALFDRDRIAEEVVRRMAPA